MTKEQEEVINKLRKITNRQILYGNKFGITIEGFRELQEDIETVLNMLKENSAEIHQKNTELAEKNAEIEKYKKLLADNLARNLNDSIKAKEKADTDLDDLDKGWKVELEKKDKQIDLMAKYLAINGVERDICNEKRIKENCKNVTVDNITVHRCKECIKQYFERKVEEC